MSPRKIIIDTDPGVDDVLAILLALSSPEVTVSLISIVFGNTHAPTAHSNLLKIYHQLGAELDASSDAVKRYNLFAGQERTKTILALGEDQPIDGEKATAAYFHGMDGLSNISELHPHFNPPKRDETELHKYLDISSKPAWECILDQLRDEPEGTVDIVAVGPLTNLAHAFKNDPATFKRVHSVIWMGGAMDVPGNTSPSAEFNCFADPYAADQILAACKQGAFKLIMAPLDITSPHTVPFDDLIVTKPEDDVAKQDKNGVPGPLRVFISSFLHRVRGLQASFGAPDAMEMHDPLAIWYAIDNADLPTGSNGWETEQRDFKIERNGEITRGMCVIDRRGGKDGSGELRTKDESLQGNKVPGQKDQSEEEGQKPLPYIITKTPGKENLRKLLLARVFGEEV